MPSTMSKTENNAMIVDVEGKKPFKIKNVARNIRKSAIASSLVELCDKVSQKFERPTETPTIHLDIDGTEVDDEEYFSTLDAHAELVAVFPGEHWIDPTRYVTITSHREPTDTTDAAAETTARIQQLVGQLQNNLCNVSVLNDADLESLSNMDPNSLVDITGKDFILDSLRDSGRPLCAKRSAEDRINLLKLLKDGAIFCSERYPEDAEAIDMEINRQFNTEATTTAPPTTTTKTKAATKCQTKTIEKVQNAAAAEGEVGVAGEDHAEDTSDVAAVEAIAAVASTTATTSTTTPTPATTAAINKTNDI